MARLSLKQIRDAFAEELRVTAPIQRNKRIVKAFTSVPREQFFGSGPWLVRALKDYRTSDGSPQWLYHNVLISLNARKGINSGEPRLWAYLLDQLNIKRGERILQVGAGTGYYTAILAQLVGTRGAVHAVEAGKGLAARAKRNLAAWPQVNVISGDASSFDAGQIDLVIVFAGGTHPADIWLKRLAPGGRLLMPLVADDGGGFMLRVVRHINGFKASALCRCWFILAEGIRTKREARDLGKALGSVKGPLPKLDALYLGRVPHSEYHRAFFIGRDYWLSKG